MVQANCPSQEPKKDDSPFSVIRMIPINTTLPNLANDEIIQLVHPHAMLSPPLSNNSINSNNSRGSNNLYEDSDEGNIDVLHDEPQTNRFCLGVSLNQSIMPPNKLSGVMNPIKKLEPPDYGIGYELNERRRGRPRKPDSIHGKEDGKVLAKRLYARQYRENVRLVPVVNPLIVQMKTRYDSLKAELDRHIRDKMELKMQLYRIQHLPYECACLKKTRSLYEYTEEKERAETNEQCNLVPLDLSLNKPAS